jgi:A/G-specific adenine glycosylase
MKEITLSDSLLKSNKKLSVKMSNMNMNIKVENHKMNKPIPFSYWINPEKLSDYTLPTFTKKIVTYLEKNK